MEAKEIIDTYKNFVVIGVTNNQDKYGYKIFKRVLDLGYTTYGVSPKYTEVLGQRLYKDLISITSKIDVVILVVNPKYGKDYIDQCSQLGIKHIWLQPGTYDKELLKYIEDKQLNSYQNCILVETNGR